MIKFHKCNPKDSLFDSWISAELNVLMIGEKGVGKTHLALDAFKRNNLKYAYFSGATLDPWIHLLGIPKAKEQADGSEKMEFILPHNLSDDVEAIFCDEFNRCFVGDTMIQLPDGHSVPIKSLVGKEEFFVYSYDLKHKKTAIGRGHSCRVTQTNAPIVKVTLDDGQVIRCTKNHLFLCSDMQYREAGNLKENQSLMALYKKNNRNGYEEVKATIESSWKYTYWLADEYNLEAGKYSPMCKRRVSRHHIDHNKHNNNPYNITQMDYMEHIRHHGNDYISTSSGGTIAHKRHPDLYIRTIGNEQSKALALGNSLRTRKNNRAAVAAKSSASLKRVWTEEKKNAASERAIAQWKTNQFSNINRQEALKKTHLSFTCKVLYSYTNDVEITFEKYCEIYEENKHSFTRGFQLNKPSTIMRYFDDDFSKFSEYYKQYINDNPLLNHRVVSVVDDGYEDVYDFTVDNYHNFLLGAGVFVHNCNKIVRNALLELQQFKSINGRKFPNLKVVWGAINPPKTDDDNSQEYDVDEMDPAQLDRFHIIIELPNEPNKKFFIKKFGEHKAKVLIDWWKEQSLESKKILSPRRLEYVGDCFNKGLDIRYLLPTSANATELIRELSVDGNSDIAKILATPTDETMEAIMTNEKTLMQYRRILKEEKYWKYWKYITNKEFLIQEIKMNEQFAIFAVHEAIRGEQVFKDALKDVHSTNPEKSIFRAMNEMKKAKYVIPVDDDLDDIVPKNNIPFSTLSKGVENKTLPPISPGSFATDNNYSCQPMNDIMYSNIFTHIANIFLDQRMIENPRRVCAFGNCLFVDLNTSEIKDKNKIVPFMGDIVRLSKEHLTPSELDEFINFIEKTKLSQNRKDEYIKYLKGETSVEKDVSPMSEKFLRDYKAFEKIKIIDKDNEIREVREGYYKHLNKKLASTPTLSLDTILDNFYND